MAKRNAYDSGQDDAEDNWYDQKKYRQDSDYRAGHDRRSMELKKDAARKQAADDWDSRPSASDYSDYGSSNSSSYSGSTTTDGPGGNLIISLLLFAVGGFLLWAAFPIGEEDWLLLSFASFYLIFGMINLNKAIKKW